MDVMGSIAAASQALDIVKKLRELEGDLKQAEVKLQLADLYGKLAEVKIALADAQAEIKAKEAEIAALKEVNEGKVKTFMHNGFKFGIDEAGKPFRRAFCPTCLQEKGIQVQISEGIHGHDICPSCSGIYAESDVTLPSGFKLPNA